MTRWKKLTAHVVLLTLIAYAVGMSFYALATGDIRGRFGWISFGNSPLTFLLLLTGNVVLLGLGLLALQLLYRHEHLFVSAINRAKRMRASFRAKG